MTTLDDISGKLDQIKGAQKEQGKQLGSQSKQINVLGGEVSTLTERIADVKKDLKEYRDDSLIMNSRLVVVETKVDERTQPGNATGTINTDSKDSLAPIAKAKIKTLNAKAKLYIALAGLTGVAATALAGWLAT